MNSDLRYRPPQAPLADIEQEDMPVGTLNPWFSMWLRPRATIRQIVATDPNRLVIALAMLIGVLEVLNRASNQSMGDRLSLGAILATAVVLGPFLGLIMIHLYAWLVRWTGRMLSGRADLVQIRAALVWGYVPTIWTALTWVPALLILQKELFTTDTPQIESSLRHLLLLLGVTFAQIVGAIWSLVAICKGLGQVQGFSAWKALGNAILAGLVVIVPIVVVALAMRL
jgi:hypothetical protein